MSEEVKNQNTEAAETTEVNKTEIIEENKAEVAEKKTEVSEETAVKKENTSKEGSTQGKSEEKSGRQERSYGSQQQRRGGYRQGRDSQGQQRFPRFKRKICRFCYEKELKIDYKNSDILENFITDRGKILPRRVTGTCSKHQRSIAREIKRARIIALLPFVEQ
jgi:small subunit ribosomal protein S18